MSNLDGSVILPEKEYGTVKAMQVQILPSISDRTIDANQASNQRQIAIAVTALPEPIDAQLPLNLCLILDRSGSMKGKPLATVKQAAKELIQRLQPEDRISVVSFDHEAEVVVSNRFATDISSILSEIDSLQAAGGTSIDTAIKAGLQELATGQKDTVSQAFILTDGENGDNARCLKLAEFASSNKFILNTLGFGDNWNQNILEKIADIAAGSLAYIEKPEKAVDEFGRLFRRMQSVGLTNAYLQVSLPDKVRLAELKPAAQVQPDVVELTAQSEGDLYLIKLGDLLKESARVLMLNTYIGNLGIGEHEVAQFRVIYDDPGSGREEVISPLVSVKINAVSPYQPFPDATIQQYTLALAKYRQTQLAEQKLQAGDRAGAATLLQTAAKTALQLGDTNAATVLQTSATQLQAGQDLSEADKKKTRIVSKTILQ
jgi:Ca-activated chloride channel family protein